jgi:uncharacterized protein (TIGR02246 family)
MEAHMSRDEEEIRAVVTRWLEATSRGDTQAVMDLMTDDALFLVPGQPPMDRAAFKAASEAQAASGMSIRGDSEIMEVEIVGDLAYLWSHLTVTIRDSSAAPAARAGHTLTIFRKADNRWRLSRDANLLVKNGA